MEISQGEPRGDGGGSVLYGTDLAALHHAHFGAVARDAAGELCRDITIFLPQGHLYRRVDETHRLVLYEPADIEELLTETGFACERLPGYGDTLFPPGWHGFVASKGR